MTTGTTLYLCRVRLGGLGGEVLSAIVTLARTRFPALRASFPRGLIGLLDCLCPFVIAQSDYFGFGFTKLNRVTL